MTTTLERVLTGQNDAPSLQAAVELDGELFADPELAVLSDSELQQRAINNKTDVEEALMECCRDVVEYVRRAGTSRTGRAEAIKKYGDATGYQQHQVYELLAVGRWVPPHLRALYPTLEYGHLRDAVRYTSRKGETEAERQGRIIRVLDISADENLIPIKTRALAREIDRQEPEPEETPPPVAAVEDPPTRGAFLEPYEEPVPAGAAALPDAREWEQLRRELAAAETRCAALEASNAALREKLAAAQVRPGLPDQFREGLCLRYAKLHGHQVPVEVLSRLAQIAETHLRERLA